MSWRALVTAGRDAHATRPRSAPHPSACPAPASLAPSPPLARLPAVRRTRVDRAAGKAGAFPAYPHRPVPQAHLVPQLEPPRPGAGGAAGGAWCTPSLRVRGGAWSTDLRSRPAAAAVLLLLLAAVPAGCCGVAIRPQPVLWATPRLILPSHMKDSCACVTCRHLPLAGRSLPHGPAAGAGRRGAAAGDGGPC